MFLRGIAAALLLCAAAAQAAPVNVCQDSRGRPVIGDTKPSTCTSPSVAELDALAAQKARAEEAIRTKRQTERAQAALLVKYPNETALRLAREDELKPFRERLAEVRAKLARYALERKPIANETEFYAGGQLPAKWQRLADQNDAQVAAQQNIVRGIEQAMSQVNATFDDRLAGMRKLWVTREASLRP